MVDWHGRVAVITGGARGQGRSHALRLAREGIQIAVCDRMEDYPSVGYPLATGEDLTQTQKLVEELGSRCIAERVDVSDYDAVAAFVEQVTETFGQVDVLLANAGISHTYPLYEYEPSAWHEMIDANLTGVFNSIRAVAGPMMSQQFGRIVATSSILGRYAVAGQTGYCAAKWGVIGMVKATAIDLAPFGITVNAVAPGNVDTPMVMNSCLYKLTRPDLEEPTWEDAAEVLKLIHVQPIALLQPEEISEAIMFLLNAEHVTGTVVDVNAGAAARYTA
jgi:SDR family mycofactocin-dependent oxidoreductase